MVHDKKKKKKKKKLIPAIILKHERAEGKEFAKLAQEHKKFMRKK